MKLTKKIIFCCFSVYMQCFFLSMYPMVKVKPLLSLAVLLAGTNYTGTQKFPKDQSSRKIYAVVGGHLYSGDGGSNNQRTYAQGKDVHIRERVKTSSSSKNQTLSYPTVQERIQQLQQVSVETLRFLEFSKDEHAVLEKYTCQDWACFIAQNTLIVTREQQFELFSLYQFEGYRKYLQSLPDYHDQIHALAVRIFWNQAEHNRVFKNGINTEPRYVQGWDHTFFCNYIKKQADDAKYVINKKWIDAHNAEQELEYQKKLATQAMSQNVAVRSNPLVVAQRTQALADLNNNSLQVNQQTYTLTDLTRNMLTALHIDLSKYTSFNGNCVQHEIHREIIALINRSAQQQVLWQSCESLNSLLCTTVKLADVSMQYNEQGQYEKSWALLDFGTASLDYVTTGVESNLSSPGDPESFGKLVTAIEKGAHKIIPYTVEAIVGIPKLAEDVLRLVIAANSGITVRENWQWMPAELQQKAMEQDIADGQRILDTLKAITKKISEMEGPEIVEELVANVGSIALFNKMLQATGKVCCAVGTVKISKVKQPKWLISERLLEIDAQLGKEIDVLECTIESQSIKVCEVLFADSSLENFENLDEAITLFKHMASASNKNGPIGKVIECTGDPKKLTTLRGAVYELEVALNLVKSGQEVVVFGDKLELIGENGIVIKRLEIDIVTPTKLIECKNWNWTKVPQENINKIKKQLLNLQKIAVSQGKTFELHSKKLLPETLKRWLIENNIPFCEG